MDGLGAKEIDRGKLETARQAEDRLVATVDELAAVLARLAVEPGHCVGVHPPADPARGFVDGGCDPGVLESERGVQAGDATADDGNAALGAGRPPDCRDRCGGAPQCGRSHRCSPYLRVITPASGTASAIPAALRHATPR